MLKHALLDRGEELLGFSQSQAQMLDALVVLFQGDEVGDGFFTAIIATYDQLSFDTHGEASSGSGGG